MITPTESAEKGCTPVNNSHLLDYSRPNVGCGSADLFHDPLQPKPRSH